MENFLEETDIDMWNISSANYSINVTAVTNDDDDPINKSMVYIEMFSVVYIVGIMGSFLALLHLYRKKNYKNNKQALMLK